MLGQFITEAKTFAAKIMSNMSTLRYSLTVVTNLVSVKRLSALEWQKHRWSQMVQYQTIQMYNVLPNRYHVRDMGNGTLVILTLQRVNRAINTELPLTNVPKSSSPPIQCQQLGQFWP